MQLRDLLSVHRYQNRLGTFERLELAFLIYTQHRSIVRWRSVSMNAGPLVSLRRLNTK